MAATLNKSDWLAAGLEVLRVSGSTSLKAQILAKRLKVSRGSFYWHFKDMAEYEAAILDAWREATTEKVINALRGAPSKMDRLRSLIVFASRAPELERAVRTWSMSNRAVAATVAEIDQQRFNYLEKLLCELGVDKSLSRHRALVLYWAGIGQTVVENTELQGFKEGDVEKIAEWAIS